jgi:hypothetical protein
MPPPPARARMRSPEHARRAQRLVRGFGPAAEARRRAVLSLAAAQAAAQH